MAKTNETNPGAGTPEAAPANPAAPPGTAPPLATQQIACDDAESPALYYNFARVSGTAEEVILDFGLNPQPLGIPEKPIKVTQKLVSNYYTAKRLLLALQLTIQRHEAVFGVLEIDVNKRVRGMPGMGGPGMGPRP
jgi:hypothetical protein